MKKKKEEDREHERQVETSRRLHNIEAFMDIDNPNRHPMIGELARSQSLAGLQHNFNRASPAPRDLSPQEMQQELERQEKEELDLFETEHGPLGTPSAKKLKTKP